MNVPYYYCPYCNIPSGSVQERERQDAVYLLQRGKISAAGRGKWDSFLKWPHLFRRSIPVLFRSADPGKFPRHIEYTCPGKQDLPILAPAVKDTAAAGSLISFQFVLPNLSGPIRRYMAMRGTARLLFRHTIMGNKSA